MWVVGLWSFGIAGIAWIAWSALCHTAFGWLRLTAKDCPVSASGRAGLVAFHQKNKDPQNRDMVFFDCRSPIVDLFRQSVALSIMRRIQRRTEL